MDNRTKEQPDNKNLSTDAVEEKDKQSTALEDIPPEIRTSEATIKLSHLLAERGVKMHHSKRYNMSYFRLDGKDASSSEDEQSEEKPSENFTPTFK